MHSCLLICARVPLHRWQWHKVRFLSSLVFFGLHSIYFLYITDSPSQQDKMCFHTTNSDIIYYVFLYPSDQQLIYFYLLFLYFNTLMYFYDFLCTVFDFLIFNPTEVDRGKVRSTKLYSRGSHLSVHSDRTQTHAEGDTHLPKDERWCWDRWTRFVLVCVSELGHNFEQFFILAWETFLMEDCSSVVVYPLSE